MTCAQTCGPWSGAIEVYIGLGHLARLCKSLTLRLTKIYRYSNTLDQADGHVSFFGKHQGIYNATV